MTYATTCMYRFWSCIRICLTFACYPKVQNFLGAGVPTPKNNCVHCTYVLIFTVMQALCLYYTFGTMSSNTLLSYLLTHWANTSRDGPVWKVGVALERQTVERGNEFIAINHTTINAIRSHMLSWRGESAICFRRNCNYRRQLRKLYHPEPAPATVRPWHAVQC